MARFDIRKRVNSKSLGLMLILVGVSSFFLLILFSDTILRMSAVLFTAAGFVAFLYPKVPLPGGFSNKPEASEKRTTHLVLSFIYLFAVVAALIAWVARSETYSRPSIFPVLLSFAFATLLVEVLITEGNKRYNWVILIKTIALSLITVLSLPTMFPGVIGMDPWWHRAFALGIQSSGRVPSGTLYSGLPSSHIEMATLDIISDLADYTIAYWVMIASVVTTLTLGVFLMTRAFFGWRVALISVFILSVSEYVIDLETLIVPTIISFSLIPFLSLLHAKNVGSKPASYGVLFLTLSLFIVSCHPLSALLALLLLATPTLYFRFRNSTLAVTPFTRMAFFPLLFAVLMIAWWSIAPVTFESALDTISLRFQLRFTTPTTESAQYISAIGPSQILISQVGFLAFLTLAGTGYIITFLRRNMNPKWTTWLLFETTILVAAGVGALLALTGLLPGRWLFYLQCVFCSSAAISTLLLTTTRRTRTAIAASVVVALLLCLPLSASPRVNFDNPFLTEPIAVRFGLTRGEQSSLTYILPLTDSTIRIDQYSVYFIAFGVANDTVSLSKLSASRVRAYDSMFLSGDMSGFHGVTVIRNEIVDHPFYANGPLRLSFDPVAMADNDTSSSRVFSSGLVVVYWQP